MLSLESTQYYLVEKEVVYETRYNCYISKYRP